MRPTVLGVEVVMPVEPWASYPPEMNAARFAAGPGPAGWEAGAQAWAGMASDAAAALGTFMAQKSSLAEQVFGVSSAAQMAAAGGYGGWLASMHALADAQAVALTGAAAAYRAGSAAMVPLEAVAANRASYSAACGSSVLGPADPTAVALQVQYGQMWAQNGATMLSYDMGTSLATVFRGYPPPPPLITSLPGQTTAETVANSAEELGQHTAAKAPGGRTTAMANRLAPMAMQAFSQAGQLPAKFASMLGGQLSNMFSPVQQVMGQLVTPVMGALGNGLGTGGAGLGSTPAVAKTGAPVRGGLPLGRGSGTMGGLRLATGAGSDSSGGSRLGRVGSTTVVRNGPRFAGIAIPVESGRPGTGGSPMGAGMAGRRHHDSEAEATGYRGGETVERAKTDPGAADQHDVDDHLFD